MNKILAVIIFLIIAAPAFPDDIKDKTEAVIKSNFKSEVTLELQKYIIPAKLKQKIEAEAKQRFFSESVFLYKIFSGGSLQGYAVLDNVYGKSMPITFLVVFDKSGSIISTEIIKYREPYGGGVSNEKWNRQFEGKTSKSDYTVGKSVDGITGATISVHSVTAGIKKAALLISYIKDSL